MVFLATGFSGPLSATPFQHAELDKTFLSFLLLC